MAKDHEAAHESRPRRAAATEYPLDRFDAVEPGGPVGAHRVTAQQRVTWRFVLGGLIGAALLTTIGIVGVTIAGSAGKLPISPPSGGGQSQAKVQPVLDPEATVAVLDGTAAEGAAAQAVASEIADEKWGVIALAGPAAAADAEISAVFYSHGDDEAAALGLAQKLGGVSTYLTTEYADSEARLIVLIGQDYAGPGKL